MPHSRKMHGDILRVGCLKLFRRFEHHQRTTPWTGNNGDDENGEDEPELGLKKLTGTLPVSTLSTLGETPFCEIPCRQNGNKPRNVSASCSNEGKGRMPLVTVRLQQVARFLVASAARPRRRSLTRRTADPSKIELVGRHEGKEKPRAPSYRDHFTRMVLGRVFATNRSLPNRARVVYGRSSRAPPFPPTPEWQALGYFVGSCASKR